MLDDRRGFPPADFLRRCGALAARRQLVDLSGGGIPAAALEKDVLLLGEYRASPPLALERVVRAGA